jgi:peptide/nickel transport system substrate-binding protein
MTFSWAGLLKLGRVAALSLAATVASLSPAAAEGKTITAVMHSALRILDPIITTAYITRNHGYMIYDTLVAMDEHFQVKPQMADWTVSDDRLTYTFTLRDGLKWHDGQPVTAADCVASLKRWGQRDTLGQALMEKTAALEAKDDRTIVLTLKEPYGLVLDSIGKPSSLVPFMMPKRVAETPADQPITDYTGSGPFRFVTAEFQPGVKAVYEKFADYVPRAEAPSWASGGKDVKVDRVEWVVMSDMQTAVSALLSGEIDFIEQVQIDLLPLFEGNDEVTVHNANLLGFQNIGRMNFLYPPFDNQKVRQAALYALNPKDFMDALVGNPDYYQLCGSMYGCGTALASEAGAVKPDIGKAKQLLREAGYDGTPVVLMAPTDVITLSTQPNVAAQALRQAGFTIDLQAMDWQTLVTRRASQAAPKDGGWNLFFTNFVTSDMLNPLASFPFNAKGPKGGWFGWPTDAATEDLRARFGRSQDPAEQKAIAEELQRRAYDQVLYLPLGQYAVPSAWRTALTGVLDGPAPYFWHIEKSE